jgi:cytochrome c nitrite reductase small subunit
VRARSYLASFVAAALIGVAAGVGGFTFLYARGASYLSNDPAACANCHVMRGHLDAWVKSSHHRVAVCNDCHTPQTFFAKYWVKAENGLHHSMAFTTGDYPDAIQIRDSDRAVVEKNCRRCHGDIVLEIAGPHGRGEEITCTRCHRTVGHDR